MANIAVVGAGSVGGFFAAHLSATDNTVVACVRRPFSQYVIDSPEAPFTGPAQTAIDPADVPWEGTADWVFVGLKAHQTAGAAPWFERLCGTDTRVVVMQNGVEGRERLEPLANGASIIPAVVYCGAELVAPGHIRHTTSRRLIVPADDDGRALAELCADTCIEIDPSATYLRSAWVKLGINSAANGLTALTGRPMTVLAEPHVSQIAERLLTECWTVARAEGADLELTGIADYIARMGSRGGDEGRTSMLQDREAGRPTEHDAIHGAIVRAGQRHGIPTPTTEVVHNLLAATSV